MEANLYKAYQLAVEKMKETADPEQVRLCNELAELMEADPQLTIKFLAFQVTTCIAALVANGMITNAIDIANDNTMQ